MRQGSMEAGRAGQSEKPGRKGSALPLTGSATAVKLLPVKCE